jgi:hypothetical protein
LSVGGNSVVISDAELRIGEVACLRIRPGSITDIAAARRELENMREKIAVILSGAGVGSIEEARNASDSMKSLSHKKKSLIDELERSGVQTIDDSLRETETALSRVSKRTAIARDAGIDLPDDRDSLELARTEADDQARLLGEAHKKEEGELEKMREKSDKLAKKLSDAKDKLETQKGSLKTQEGRFHLMQEKYGSAEKRIIEISALSERKKKASAAREVVIGKIALLQPEFIDDDIARLHQSVEQTQASINSISTNIGAAKSLLTLTGTDDPEADFERAKARFEQLEARHAGLAKDAAGIRHLMETAERVRKGLTEKFAMPLEAAAGRYLSCMFGSGASVRIDLDAGKNMCSEIIVGRQEAGLGNFSFDSLSEGAKEQVGIAMRLAMTEVLAADHDGCLPVVLDDAFTSSDPERVGLVQRMLFNAAKSGLQIIVFSCNPTDYRTLGATEFQLVRPRLSAAIASIASESHVESDSDEPPQTTILPQSDPEGESLFIQKLTDLGGKAGNGNLRETLGWDEETFDRIKSALLQSGKITPGKGRGGSVKIPGIE